MRVIPLHLHSHWSLLDGVPSVKEIVAFAETSPAPDISTLYDHTYAEPEHQAMIVPAA